MKKNNEHEVTYYSYQSDLRAFSCIAGFLQHVGCMDKFDFKFKSHLYLVFAENEEQLEKLVVKVEDSFLYFKVIKKTFIEADSVTGVISCEELTTKWMPIDKIDMALFCKPVHAVYYKDAFVSGFQLNDKQYRASFNDVFFINMYNKRVLNRLIYAEVEGAVSDLADIAINNFNKFFIEEKGFALVDIEHSKISIGRQAMNEPAFFRGDKDSLIQCLYTIFENVYICSLNGGGQS